MAKKSTKKAVEVEIAKVVEEKPKKSTKKENIEAPKTTEKVEELFKDIENNKMFTLPTGVSGSLISEPEVELVSDTLKEKYRSLSQSGRYELYWKGIKIFDSMTHRVSVEFNDDHILVNGKMYPYYGIRFNLK